MIVWNYVEITSKRRFLILQPIPKTDMHLASGIPSIAVPHRRLKHLPITIRNIPDDLWNEIKLILPPEKAEVGQDANGKCFQKNMAQVLHVIGDFRSGQYLKYFKNCG